MSRTFRIPDTYRSDVIGFMKAARRIEDGRKKDLSPSILDLGTVRFKIARHFGFCFGVENAIEIAYRAIFENPGKRVFLLSEMIHNPQVNADLMARGVRFLMTTDGQWLINLTELHDNDIVIVPAFGTTVELFEQIRSRGINPLGYNATCPFVEKVWKRSAQLGERGFTVIIHGKHTHEETRATFSHARQGAPSLVIRDHREALLLAEYLRGERDMAGFASDFAGRFSEGFEPERDLVRVGVVNQTTMLATETQEIAELLREAVEKRYGSTEISEHWADTRDTLCYATSENQGAIEGLLASGGDIALVVGGYNSSNTSHLVELLEKRVPTYYVKDASEILSADAIQHLVLTPGVSRPLGILGELRTTTGWWPALSGRPVEVLLSAGASCPDKLVDQVLVRVAELRGVAAQIPENIKRYRDVIESSGDSKNFAAVS